MISLIGHEIPNRAPNGFARKSERAAGQPVVFALAAAIILLWQLVVNTGTTIITFLMVFLIQNTQNLDAVNVVTIVAWAGAGKPTLVNHWLRRMAAEKYRSAELVFGWSFYRQGSSGDTSSADEFLDATLTWFGDADPRLGTAWEKGKRLANLVAHRRTLSCSRWTGAGPKSAWSTRRTITRAFPPGSFARTRCLQFGALRDYHADAGS